MLGIIAYFAMHSMLNIIRAKLKLILHIVGRPKLFLHPFVSWSMDVMFANSKIGIAQSP